MFAIDYKDLGTPASPAPAQVTVDIDGAQVTVPEGTSVMRAAALAGSVSPSFAQRTR